MSGIVVVAVAFGCRMKLSEAVFHVESFGHSCEAWRHFGGWIMGTIYFVDDAVHITTNAT